MALSLKAKKQNVKWAPTTENLCDTDAQEKPRDGSVHSSDNFHKDIESPKRMVASPNRFKTQIIKIFNIRETKNRSVITHRRSLNGVQVSKSLSAGEIGCLRCKSNHGTKRSSNFLSTRSVEFSSNGNVLKSRAVGRKRMLFDSKYELTKRSATQKDEIKERLEKLRKNTNRLLRKSIERKNLKEQMTDRTNQPCKYQGLEKNCKQNIDISVNQLNTPKPRNIEMLATKSESDLNKNHNISLMQPLKGTENATLLNKASKSFEISADGCIIDKDSIGHAPMPDATLNSQIQTGITENEDCFSECFTGLDPVSCASSPVLQSQNHQIKLMPKRESEKLSQCKAGIISVDKESQCLTDKRNKPLTPLSLEMPAAYLRRTKIDNSDNQFNSLNASGAHPRETNVRKHEMPFRLLPSPIHTFPYNFVLAVRRKLEYIVSRPSANIENTESIKKNENTDLQQRTLFSNTWVSENDSKDSDTRFLSESNSFVSGASFISGAEKKWNNLIDSDCSNQLNYCATSGSSNMSALNAPNASHAESTGEEFEDDDTTISSSVFDSPDTMESTLGFDDEDVVLESVTPLRSGHVDHTEKTFCEDSNLSQLLDDFNQSLSEAMQVNEQLKNNTRLSCTGRDDVHNADNMEPLNSTSSCQLNDDSGSVNLSSLKAKSLPCIQMANNMEFFIHDSPQDDIPIKPIAVTPLNLPNLRQTRLTDESKKFIQESGSSTSFEYESNPSEYSGSYANKSQPRLAKDKKTKNSSCESNELDNKVLKIQPACFDNVKAVQMNSESSIRIVKKSATCTKQNNEAFIKTASRGNENNIKRETGISLSSNTEKIGTTSVFRPSKSALSSSANPPSASSRSTLNSGAMPTDHFKNLLQKGEKILIDRTKSQIAWLEVLKEYYKENRLVTHIATIKKKQRGLLLKLDQDREKMKRLLYSTIPAFNNKTNTPAGITSSKENRSEPFNSDSKPRRTSSTAAALRGQRADSNLRLIGNLYSQREPELYKTHDSTDYSQCLSEDESEVVKLNGSPLNASKNQLRKLDQLPFPERIVLKEKLEEHIKNYTEKILKKSTLAHQSMKRCEANCKMPAQRSTNLKIIQDNSQVASRIHDVEQQSKEYIVKAEVREAENQINKNKSDLSPASSSGREMATEIQSSDQSSLPDDFNTNEGSNCPCSLDIRESPTSCTETESLFSARQELLERKNLIECNIKKFVSKAMEVVAQHAILRRSLSYDEISQANAIVRSDHCKTWPSSRKSSNNNRFSADKEQIINTVLEENNLIDVNQMNEQEANSSNARANSKCISVDSNKRMSQNFSKSDVSGTTRLTNETEVDATSNHSSSGSSYLKSTDSDTKSDRLSQHCQREKDDSDTSTTRSKTDTKLTVSSEASSDFSHECARITEVQMPSTPIADSIIQSGSSPEIASEELTSSLESKEKQELSKMIKPPIANNALKQANEQSMSEIIDIAKDRRSRQPLRDSERQINNNVYGETYIREIPNKPPPPYVSPAPGSPMTTIFPSEDRIRDITFRRSHELFCELLNMDYTSPKGDKLPSVMDERITNIYERIILDICKEYLNDHMNVVSQGNPADFHGQLAFFNPPDRLICIQNAIYKEVHRCLTMNKSSPKHHQVFSIYGQRAKRDHIGKIIIQEIYDEDDQWCNFLREENEVLELMVGEMVSHQILKLSEEEWSH